jgi:hypothetical protein
MAEGLEGSGAAGFGGKWKPRRITAARRFHWMPIGHQTGVRDRRFGNFRRKLMGRITRIWRFLKSGGSLLQFVSEQRRQLGTIPSTDRPSVDYRSARNGIRYQPAATRISQTAQLGCAVMGKMRTAFALISVCDRRAFAL